MDGNVSEWVEDSCHGSGPRNQSDELSQFHRGTSLNKSCSRNQIHGGAWARRRAAPQGHRRQRTVAPHHETTRQCWARCVARMSKSRPLRVSPCTQATTWCWRVAPFVNGDAMESMRIEGEKAVPVRFQRHRDRPLVIARPGTNLAAEDPIRPRRISDDHRQQEKRADEKERL